MPVLTERKAGEIDLSYLEEEAASAGGQTVPELPSDDEEDDEAYMNYLREQVRKQLGKPGKEDETKSGLNIGSTLENGTQSVTTQGGQLTAKSSKTSVRKGWSAMTDLDFREPVGTNHPWPRDETKTVGTTASTSTRGKSNTKRGGGGRGKRGGRGGGTSRGDSNNDFYTRSKCGESSRGSSAGGRGSY